MTELEKLQSHEYGMLLDGLDALEDHAKASVGYYKEMLAAPTTIDTEAMKKLGITATKEELETKIRGNFRSLMQEELIRKEQITLLKAKMIKVKTKDIINDYVSKIEKGANI